MSAHCHTGSKSVKSTASTATSRRVAVIGQPNNGKSTFFNRITNAGAGVANWPGLTVDLFQATVQLDHHPVEFVDLPGIYDLNGYSDDEKVVQQFLETTQIDLVLVMLNASQIDRQIRTPLQVDALGLPAVVILNMADEAKQFGIEINAQELSTRLGMPIFLISAKYGTGCAVAIAGIAHALDDQPNTYQVTDISASLAQNPVTDARIKSLLHGAVRMPSPLMITLTNKIDRVMLHPVLGLPLFFLSMFAVFWLIWTVGIPTADPVNAATAWLQDTIVDPLIAPLPEVVKDFLINGVWNGVTSVASFLPLIGIFFMLMAALEDSGYLSRAAYLMDAFMARVGLDGRAFVMQLMGFGCNVPAIMGTRVMRSRAMRLLSMLVIPFALCSARLQVFVFILAAVLPGPQGAIALFLLYLLSFAVAFLLAAIMSRSSKIFKSTEPFVLEIPPYRLPTIKHVLLRAWGEMKSFAHRASTFIVLGTILTWLLTNLPPGAEGLDTFAGKLGGAFSPIMEPIGINPFLTVSLIFGFIAKEVQIGALAVVYGLGTDALGVKIGETLSFAQAFSYCVFSLLYVPCLTTVATIFGESRSGKFTAFSVALSMTVAWVASFIFYQSARLLGFQ